MGRGLPTSSIEEEEFVAVLMDKYVSCRIIVYVRPEVILDSDT
jgi:hypothetical protein